MPSTGASLSVGLQVNNNLALGNVGGNVSFNAQLVQALSSLTKGSGANQFNAAYLADRTVSNGTPDTIDLNAGTIKEPDGVTAVSLTDIILLAILNRSTTAGQNLQVGGGTNDITTILGASGVITIFPGGLLLLTNPNASGYGITASTADILDINVAAGTSVPYSIAILGH